MRNKSKLENSSGSVRSSPSGSGPSAQHNGPGPPGPSGGCPGPSPGPPTPGTPGICETPSIMSDVFTSTVSVGGPTASTVAIATHPPIGCCCCCRRYHACAPGNAVLSGRKCAVGCVLMVCGAICWVGATQCVRRLYSWPSFYAPFFVVYFSTAWVALLYPVCLAGQFIYARGRLRIKETFRESIRVYGEETLRTAPLRILGKCAAFCSIWVLTAYLYVRALSFKGCLDVIALFATNSNFVYVLSWIILQKKFISVRIVAFIVAMTGIIMVMYLDTGFASDDMWGSVLVMVATGAAAGYKVLIRRVFGDVTYDQMSFFLSCLGLCNIATMWPIFLLLYFTKAEPIEWDHVPWHILCGASLFALALNLLLHFGAGVTYHRLIQATFLLAMPLSVVAELLLDRDTFHVAGMQVGAYILIVIGFLLNIMPENCYESIAKAMHFKRARLNPQNEAHMTPRERLRLQSQSRPSSTC